MNLNVIYLMTFVKKRNIEGVNGFCVELVVLNVFMLNVEVSQNKFLNIFFKKYDIE